MPDLRIEILSNHLDRDKLNPGEPDVLRAEVVYWKRVVASGQVKFGGSSGRVQAILDVRARILRVSLTEVQNLGPVALRLELKPVAYGLVNKMAEFAMHRRSDLAMPFNQDGSEWLVADPEHVSGLLHRLKEAKEFTAPQTAPKPPGHAAVLATLLDAVDENLKAMFAFSKERVYPSNRYLPPFNGFAWETLRERFLRLEDDSTLVQRFARFFDHVAQYAAAVHVVRTHPKSPGPDYSVAAPHGPRRVAEEFIGQNEQEVQQLGLKLLGDLREKPFELPQHLRT